MGERDQGFELVFHDRDPDEEAQGFEISVAHGACSSREPVDERAATNGLARNGVDPATMEMMLFEWMEKAGTPEFRQIDALVK